MIDLFDAKSRIKDVVDKSDEEKDNSYLTEAAELGLRLPARAVLDLWQLAYWVTHDKTIKPHRRAEKIARTMLRNVIAESSMPSEMGRRLQEQIIRRTHQGGTMLDFEDPKLPDSALEVTRLRSPDFELPIVLLREKELYVVRSWVYVMQVNATILRLKYFPQGQHWVGAPLSGAQGGNRDINKNIEHILLPDLVSAWLTVLHDTLVWGAEDSDIIGGPELGPFAIVRCVHDTVGQYMKEGQKLEANSKQGWPAPSWRSFIAHDVFWQLWRHFLSAFKDAGLPNQASEEGSAPRLLAAGWVACVLETFLAYAKLWEWEGPSGILAKLRDKIKSGNGKYGKKAINGAEMKVMMAAADVYAEITKESRGTVYRADEVRRLMRDWLELELPYHPILRLNPPVPEQDAPPPVAIALGSDDPLTFSTELLREYTLLHQAACAAGYPERVVHEWLESIRRTGMDARFTLGWRPSAIKKAEELIIAMCKYLHEPYTVV